MSSENMMVHSAIINRNTPAVGTTRQAKSNYVTYASGVACFLQEGAGGMRNGAAGSYLEYDAIAFFPMGIDIRPRGQSDLEDQTIISGDNIPVPITFSVRLVTDESGMGDHQTAYLKRFQPSR